MCFKIFLNIIFKYGIIFTRNMEDYSNMYHLTPINRGVFLTFRIILEDISR